MSRVLIKKSKSAKKLGDVEESTDLYLTYEFNTNPSPIVVTSGDVASHADISIVVTNENYDKEFNEIIFYLPIGEDGAKSDYLTDTVENIEKNFNNNSYKVEPNAENGSYSIKSNSGESFTMEDGESFYITFHCKKVSSVVGNFLIEVQECDSSDNKSYAEFPFAKFPYGFYLNNFRAAPPIVGHGEETTLYWDGAKDKSTKYYMCIANIESKDDTSAKERQLYIEDKDVFVPVDLKKEYKTGKLNSTTFFTLKAEYTTVNNESAEYYLQLAVYVMSSDINATDINAKSITATEDIKIKGTLYVNNINQYK